jgi:hypothetical protein
MRRNSAYGTNGFNRAVKKLDESGITGHGKIKTAVILKDAKNLSFVSSLILGSKRDSSLRSE